MQPTFYVFELIIYLFVKHEIQQFEALTTIELVFILWFKMRTTKKNT